MSDREHSTDADLLMAHCGWVYGLARRLIADRDAADDLGQDAVTRALECPPRDGTRLRAWLGQVLRNAGRRAHREREMQRRHRREAAVPGSESSTADVVVRAELHRILVEELVALEEPYRSTLLRRFFDGQEPVAIAAALDLSVDTVYTRIRRGLQRLRKALARRGVVAAQLTVLAGSPLATASGTLASSSTASSSMLGGKLQATLMTLAVATLVTTAVWWRGTPEPKPNASGLRSGPESLVRTAVSSTDPVALRGPTGNPAPARLAPAELDDEERPAVVRGRCIDDETGAPLEGCEIRITAHPGRRVAHEAYVARHGPVRWTAPEPVTTGPDGLFDLSFVPPPPWWVDLRISCNGRIDREARWPSGLRFGELVELGDVSMLRGARLSGRVVDTSGNGLGNIDLSILQRQSDQPADSPTTCRNRLRSTTAPDGSFEVEMGAASGTWTLEADARQIVSDRSFQVSPDEESVVLMIVVLAEHEVDTITGVVLDDRGEPVPRAEIRPVATTSDGKLRPSSTTSRTLLTTSDDGSFRLPRPFADPRTPVRIEVRKNGYEHSRSAEFAWGSRGVRLRIVRGLSLAVTVQSEVNGEPVESYDVRCFRLPRSGGGHRSSLELEPQASGQHEEGRAQISGLLRGPSVVLVTPHDGEHAASDLLPVDVTEAGPGELLVTVPRQVSRTVRVETADGRPLVGSQVEWVRPTAAVPLTTTSTVQRLEMLFNWRPGQGLLLGRDISDADGEVPIAGPAGREIALRITGEHPPVLHRVILDEEEDPIRLTVRPGACLLGRVLPARLVEQLTPRDGRPHASAPSSEHEDWRARMAPGLRLWSRSGHGSFPVHPGSCFPIEDDGSFRIEGVPPGSWELRLAYKAPLGRGTFTSESEAVGHVVDLRLGERRELELDLREMVPGELRGSVNLNGSALDGATVQLQGTGTTVLGETRKGHGPSAAIGAGSFELTALPGRYRLHFNVPVDHPQRSAEIVVSELEVEVLPDQPQELSLSLCTGDLQLRLTRADGTPVEGAPLWIAPADDSWIRATFDTDHAGEVVAPLLPSGELTILLVPPSLRAPGALGQALQQQGGGLAAFRKSLIVLGSIELRHPAEVLEVEFTVPDGSGD